MKVVRAAGFTLIELLTVIAIIAILAGLTAVTLPRVLERAKITDVETDMGAIATSLRAYATDNGGYPPAYGFQLFQQSTSAPAIYKHADYTLDIGINDVIKVYDRFSDDYDTDDDGELSRLEFIPLAGDGYLDLPLLDLPYPGGQAVGAFPKRGETQRPYVYIPYFKKDMDRMKRIIGNGNAWDGLTWNGNFVGDQTLVPPPNYDGFALVSVGPLNNTRGLLKPPGDEDAWLSSTGEQMPQRAYYVLSLRAAYLSTRDADGNGQLDFDYRVRTRSGEGKLWPVMPDGQALFSAPLIYVAD